MARSLPNGALRMRRAGQVAGRPLGDKRDRDKPSKGGAVAASQPASSQWLPGRRHGEREKGRDAPCPLQAV